MLVFIFATEVEHQNPSSMLFQNALIKTVWSSIVTLTDVNAMMWKEAKAMALRHESVRVCAETRIAAFVRKEIQESKYKEMKSAALIIQKQMRQVFARRFVASLLKKMKEDEMFQLRIKCATSLQTSWRRFFWRNRFLNHQKRKIECERQNNTKKREHLRQKKKAFIGFVSVPRCHSNRHDDSNGINPSIRRRSNHNVVESLCAVN